MSEYINVEELIEICENQGHADIDDVLSVPAADVTPVIHAKWENITVARVDTTGYCSECKKQAVWRTLEPYNICPNCGAKMDAE